MENKKSHLWIPIQEIDNVPKKPTSRNKDYGIIPKEHGQKLSQNLKEILSFFEQFKLSDSLSDEDLIAFKVILQQGEDFSSRKKLIEEEGMKINVVKDKIHAIVTAPRDRFTNLQKRINIYRDKGIKKDFQYIAEFEPFRAEDKQTPDLLRYFKEHPQELTIDVQLMLLPELSPKTKETVQKKITEKILLQNGKIQNEPYQLTDGTTVIRAVVSVKNIKKICDDQGIYYIERTSFFHRLEPSVISPFSFIPKLDPNTDINRLPVVVVLDDGVDLPNEFANIVPVHWIATGVKKTALFAKHGTPVASRVVFSHPGLHMSDKIFVPRAKIIDATIVDKDTTPINIMIKRIQEAVINFSQVAKIFNFSYNADFPIDGSTMSILGSEIDLLCKKYNVKFIISAGNHHLVFSEDNLKDIIDDDDSRIAEPADAMLGITVGAIVGHTHNGSISKRNEVAPYSRRGPGFAGFFKPDITAYGATVFKNGVTPADPYAFCISKTGFCVLPGTSFTAPTVSGDLAQILTTVPNNNIELSQALLYNGAISLYDREGITQDELTLAGNLFGRGLSSPENSMYSTENRVSYIHSGTMNRLNKKRIKFHIPTVLANAKVKRGINKVRVTVTCICCPPIDRTKGSEYLAAYIFASIHRINSNGKNVVDNPSISDNRKKWDTCYHFSKEFSAFSSGSWEIWLELYTRWGVADDDEIPYSLVITVEDLLQNGNMYSEIIKETAGRYAPIQQVRVPVR